MLFLIQVIPLDNSFLFLTRTIHHTQTATHEASHLNQNFPQTPDKSKKPTRWASHSAPKPSAAVGHGIETIGTVEVDTAAAKAAENNPINNKTDQGAYHCQLRHLRKHSRGHLCCGRRQGRKGADGTTAKRRKTETTGAGNGSIANVSKSADAAIGSLQRQTGDTLTCRTRRMAQVAVSNLERSQVLSSN